MSNLDRTSMRRWARPAAIGAIAAIALAVVTAAVAGGVGGIGPLDVLRRTPTPITFNTPTVTPDPEPEDTPTDTPTNTPDPTPENTPTPFPTKDTDDLGNTVMIGGSTGSEYLDPFTTTYVPMFDAGVGTFGDVGHVMFPGAITHLTIQLTPALTSNSAYNFFIVLNGKWTNVDCFIPAKGKGDFCEDGRKVSNCVEVSPQDRIAVAALPFQIDLSGEGAGGPSQSNVRMSWVAKLDLGGSCPTDAPAIVGDSSCIGQNNCIPTAGRIGAGSCNGNDNCYTFNGVMGSGSCNGSANCRYAVGHIGNQSCGGTSNACSFNTGAIGDSSCNGFQACLGNSGDIKPGSCNGSQACQGNNQNIGKNQCNANLVCNGPNVP